jgi:hypothetical protein
MAQRKNVETEAAATEPVEQQGVVEEVPTTSEVLEESPSGGVGGTAEKVDPEQPDTATVVSGAGDEAEVIPAPPVEEPTASNDEVEASEEAPVETSEEPTAEEAEGVSEDASEEDEAVQALVESYRKFGEEANQAAIDERPDSVDEGETEDEYNERIRLASVSSIFN